MTEIINVPSSHAWHAIGVDPLLGDQRWNGVIKIHARSLSSRVRNMWLYSCHRYLCPAKRGSAAALFKWWAEHNEVPHMMVRCAGANPSKVMRGSTAAYLRTGKQLDAFFNVLESLMTVWRMTAPSKSQMGIPISSRRAYLKEQIGLEIYKRKTHILVEFRTPRDGFTVPLTTVSHVWRRCMHVYLPDETPTTNVEFHITFGKGDKE